MERKNPSFEFRPPFFLLFRTFLLSQLIGKKSPKMISLMKQVGLIFAFLLSFGILANGQTTFTVSIPGGGVNWTTAAWV